MKIAPELETYYLIGINNKQTCEYCNGTDWINMDQAIISSDGKGNGVVLYCKGENIEKETAIWTDLSNLGLEEAPHGLSIWMGTFEEESIEGESNTVIKVLKGTFRKLSIKQMLMLRDGINPIE